MTSTIQFAIYDVLGHLFSAAPVLQNSDLLACLMTNLTSEPTTETLAAESSDMPPLILGLNLISSLLELCQALLLVQVNDQSALVRLYSKQRRSGQAIENRQIS